MPPVRVSFVESKKPHRTTAVMKMLLHKLRQRQLVEMEDKGFWRGRPAAARRLTSERTNLDLRLPR